MMEMTGRPLTAFAPMLTTKFSQIITLSNAFPTIFVFFMYPSSVLAPIQILATCRVEIDYRRQRPARAAIFANGYHSEHAGRVRRDIAV